MGNGSNTTYRTRPVSVSVRTEYPCSQNVKSTACWVLAWCSDTFRLWIILGFWIRDAQAIKSVQRLQNLKYFWPQACEIKGCSTCTMKGMSATLTLTLTLTLRLHSWPAPGVCWGPTSEWPSTFKATVWVHGFLSDLGLLVLIISECCLQSQPAVAVCVQDSHKRVCMPHFQCRTRRNSSTVK